MAARKYGKKASEKVARTMREFKRGTLTSGSGGKVTSRAQAIAIGISQARAKGYKVPPAAHATKSASWQPKYGNESGAWQSGYDYAMESMRHETRAQMREALRGLSAGARTDFDRGQLAGYEEALGSRKSASHATKKKSSVQLDREVAAAIAKKPADQWTPAQKKQELKALKQAKERYFQAMGYAGNTADQVRKYHEAIAEIDAKMKLLSSHATKKRSHASAKLRIAYRLQLTPSELRAVEFARGRYSWPDMLATHATEGGLVAFTEPQMWQWADDVDSDTEGGHSPFPLAAGALADKLQRFYDERV